MLDIQEHIDRNCATLFLVGNMLDQESLQLNERVKGLFYKGYKTIVVDMSGVQLMNSCFGLGILMGCWALIKRGGGQLQIANPSPKVTHLLEMTHLNEVLPIIAEPELP